MAAYIQRFEASCPASMKADHCAEAPLTGSASLQQQASLAWVAACTCASYPSLMSSTRHHVLCQS